MIDGARARRSGVELETPELSPLEVKGHRLSPGELGLLAKKLAAAKLSACANASRRAFTESEL
jgi:hypothetical protein